MRLERPMEFGDVLRPYQIHRGLALSRQWPNITFDIHALPPTQPPEPDERDPSEISPFRGGPLVTRLIVICGRKLVRDTLVRNLSASNVSVITEGYEATEHWRSADPDGLPVVILYWKADPQRSSNIRYAIASIFSRSTRARIIVISEIQEIELIREVHSSGARAFIGTNLNFNLLITIIQLVVIGRSYFPHELLLEAGQASKTQPPSLDSYSFTPREKEIIDCIMKGMSNERISADLDIAYASVNAHVGRILRKVDARNRVELVYKLKGRWVL